VRPLGLFGDVQAERQHHGGVDQAVYAYAEEEPNGSQRCSSAR
jgi:MOSC domain-containing protein YiiM